MLRTKIRYLARDELYNTEKPCSADFVVDEPRGAKRTNIVTTECDVQVIPVSSQEDFDMDASGFCILHEDTTLTVEDALTRAQVVEQGYQAELENIILKHFPEYVRLESLDFVVRQRHPHFPSQKGEFVKYEQPAAIAHSNYTPQGAIEQLKGSFPGQEAHFLDEEYDMIKSVLIFLSTRDVLFADIPARSIWKPLTGPNNDWPLAVCDYSTVQPSDIAHADVLHVDRLTENQLLHSNEQHRWYYVPNQQPSDLIVFRNVDSTGTRAVGFHAAVPNPGAAGPPRTSVEVRFVAFR